MTDRLPDLARYDRFAIDTETAGVDYHARPVGLSIATPDDRAWYLAWGHEGGGNNCTIDEVRDWCARELTRLDQLKVCFNAPFEMRLLAYTGPGNHGLPGVGVVMSGRIEDGGICAPLLNEYEEKFTLDHLLRKHCGVSKSDDYLNEWCAAQFGGKPWRTAQIGNYWRVPAPVIEEYALDDARGHLKLYDTLRPRIDEKQRDGQDLADVYALETALLPILLKMHLTGVRVDVARAEEVHERFEKKAEELRERWEELAPGVNVNSTDQLVPIFEAAGIEIPRTQKGNLSLTKDFLERLDHPVAKLAVELREASRFGGLFVKSYVLDNAIDGVIHGEFHALPNANYGTISGRFSSGGSLNLQNLPGDRYPDLARLVRGLFIPYLDGQEWWKADYSQIEYRYLAHYAGGILRERYNADPNVDFHEMLTRMIYAADELATPTAFKFKRRVTKNTNFCIVYGGGPKKAAETASTGGIPVTVAEMEEIFNEYHANTDGVIKRLADRAQRKANARGFIRSWGGRLQRFRTAQWARSKGWKVWGSERHVKTYTALNRLLQSSAADLIKRAMVRVATEVVDWETSHLHLTVHDELDLSGPPAASPEGERFARDLRTAMEDFDLTVPIRVDLSPGPSWFPREADDAT